ncbi:MAG: alanine racemase [Peptococcaceae bacterium]|nr:alanine racemase [Peptococcaceae bacterium]
MKIYRPTWVDIDMQAARHNFQTVRQLVGEQVKICAIVKANGYGHGSVELSKLYVAEGVDFLAVATIDGALKLRNAGIEVPILVLGWTPAEAYQAAVENDVRLTMYDLQEIKKLNEAAASKGKKALVHLKIDTGMTRLGFMATEENLEQIAQALALPNIEIEGIFSHFSKADEKSKDYAYKQLAIFKDFVARLEEKTGYHIPIKHMANSAAIIDLPEAHLDMVRPGIVLCGLQPSSEMLNTADLQPVLSWKAKVSRVQQVPAGTLIGYGGTYQAEKTMTVATIPVGYADGYNRLLSNKGYVLYQGKKLPIVGRVCMDQFMVDASSAANLQAGDEVILIGSQGEQSLTVTEMAEMLQTIDHEIICAIAARVPRIYKM